MGNVLAPLNLLEELTGNVSNVIDALTPLNASMFFSHRGPSVCTSSW